LTPPHLQNSKIKLKKNYQKNRKQRLWNRSNSSRLVMMTILLCYSLFIYMYVLLQKGQKYTWQQHHEGKDQEKLGGLHLE
jgi:magnesium-transporting ATPase (P-type)